MDGDPSSGLSETQPFPQFRDSLRACIPSHTVLSDELVMHREVKVCLPGRIRRPSVLAGGGAL